MDDVQHAPLTQDVLQIEAVGFCVCPRNTAPALQVLAQVGVLTPRQGVVLEHRQRFAFFGEQRGAVILFAVDLPAQHDLAQKLLLALPFGGLCAHINDAVATGKVAPSGDHLELFISCAFNKKTHLISPKIKLLSRLSRGSGSCFLCSFLSHC